MEYDSDVEETQDCTFDVLLGPLTVLAQPFTYQLEGENYGEGCTAIFATIDNHAVRLQIDVEALTDLPKAGDVVLAVGNGHEPGCSAGIGNYFLAYELYRVKHGQVESLYRDTQIETLGSAQEGVTC